MAKKTHRFSFRTLLSIVTVLLVAYVVYQNWPDIIETVNHLQDANPWILLLLIPEQLFMYFSLGQIFFSYMRSNPKIPRLRWTKRLRISTELNFVNHAVPAGGVGGLTFLSFRFHPLGVSAGQSSFLYIFRYAVTTIVNYMQAFIAIIALLILGLIPDGAYWVITVALVLNMGMFIGLALLIFIASSKKRMAACAQGLTKLVNRVVSVVTFGHKRRVVKKEVLDQYFEDIHASVLIAKKDKKRLVAPLVWGIVFSFLEIGTYWLVAIALGHPELLPFIMIGEAIGSVFDGIIPYGLYELGMAGVMVALGVDVSLATIIVIMTRVVTLLFTILTGYWPYRKTLMTLGTKDEQPSP